MDDWNGSRGGSMALALSVALAGPGCNPVDGGGGGGRPLKLRPSEHAGSWYPGRPEELRKALDGFLGVAPPGKGKQPSKPAPREALVAILAPHAGVRYSGEVAGKAFRELRDQEVRRVFLLGPSHHLGFSGVALPGKELDGYQTPLGPMLFDQEALESLRKRPGFSGPPAAHLPEHSLELEVIFLRHLLPEARLVPMVVGGMGERVGVLEIAEGLRSLLGPGDLLVVSSDFTHYGARFGYVPFTRDIPDQLDHLLTTAAGLIQVGDLAGFEAYLDKTEDTICGREPIRIMLATLGKEANGEAVAADTSGNLTGDYQNSVSYLGMVFRNARGWARKRSADVLNAKEQELALEMARRSLVDHVHGNRPPSLQDLGVPEEGPFREPGAVFVTLELPDGSLRGCIGSILAHRPLWEDIRENAASAASRDPRFPPVRSEEVEKLHLSVTVLSRPESVPGPEAFEVGRHGVILHREGRRAVFLPQVATEQGWDRETTLEHLSQKAGFSSNAWSLPGTRFEVFEAQVLGKR